MKGWKTKLAAAGPMFLGLGLMITGALEFFDGNPDGSVKIKEGIASFSFGLGLVGIGHKVEKSARYG